MKTKNQKQQYIEIEKFNWISLIVIIGGFTCYSGWIIDCVLIKDLNSLAILCGLFLIGLALILVLETNWFTKTRYPIKNGKI